MMSFTQIFSDFFSKITKIVTHLPENISTIFQSPLSLLTLLALVIILLVLIKAKNIKFNTRMITTIGIILALTTVLDLLKIYHFPQGGGVTLGSMVPLILLSYFYGPFVGMLGGLLFGILSLFFDPYILHPVQVLFDYPLPYLCLGIAGFFPDKKRLGAAISIFARYLCHFISGVAFFGSFAPEGMSPWIYSLSVNGSLGLVEGIICIAILSLLPIERLMHSSNFSNLNTRYSN